MTEDEGRFRACIRVLFWSCSKGPEELGVKGVGLEALGVYGSVLGLQGLFGGLGLDNPEP